MITRNSFQTKKGSLGYLHGHRKTNQEHEETRDPDEDLLSVTDSEVVRPEIHHGRHEPLHTHELTTAKHTTPSLIINRQWGNFTCIESCRGKKFLVVFTQIAPVHSKFDIELCLEINKR